MSYWRMQLHPAIPGKAVYHATRSLGLGYIGLDFINPPGDLMTVNREDIEPSTQRRYHDFAHKMQVEDIVLIMAHHYPHAIVQITGDYNYIRSTDQELGVWFRHFRRVEILEFYADYVTNPKEWQRIMMPDTIGHLSKKTESYKLIEEWMNHLKAD